MRNSLPDTTILPVSRGLLNVSLVVKLLISSLLLSGVLCCAYLFEPKLVQVLNLKVTDLVLETVFVKATAKNVVTVDIDEKSIKELGQWPWPRYRIAELADVIRESGARTIGVNILFPDQDRTSPKLWQKNLQNDLGYLVDTSKIAPHLQDYDTYLGSALAGGPFVLGYEFIFGSIKKQQDGCNLEPISFSGDNSSFTEPSALAVYRAQNVICNYRPLAEAISHSGFLNGAADFDGILRRLPLIIEYEGHFFPSFGLAMLMHFRQDWSPTLSARIAAFPSLSIADQQLFVDDTCSFLLGSPMFGKPEHISAIDVLNKRITPSIFKNKMVIIGSTASGLTQMFSTPQGTDISLLDLHKYSIEALMSGRRTIRLHSFLTYEAIASFLLCILLSMCIGKLSFPVSAFVSGSALCCSWLIPIFIFQKSGYLFSPLLPSVLLILICGILFSMRFRHFQIRAKCETENALTILKSRETSLRSILKTIPDIIFRLDREGNITFISPAISKYLQSPESLVGMHIFDLVAPVDVKKATYRVNERRRGKRATSDFEIRLLLRLSEEISGQAHRYFSISSEGIYDEESSRPRVFLGTQGIAKDITEKKQLENQLIQAQKMEAIGNLAAGIAHDLNNILSGLVSYPDLLLMEIPKDSPLREKISVIQKSGKKAAVIVQDLLTLARRSVENDEICNMNQIISEYLSSVEFQSNFERYASTSLITSLSGSLLNIKGSPVQLSKVIMNLIHNCLDAMPTGGEIKIVTTSVTVTDQYSTYETIPKGEYVLMMVSDDGVGISKLDQNRIFEPFYTKKTMGRSGTGLGMTVIWGIVKDHNGYIDIQSQEGKGTRFFIYLPSTRKGVESISRRVAIEDYLGSETILVVDDINDQLDVAESILKKLGYTVNTAGSGEEAFERVSQQPFDLVILDMIMPGGMDGLETYQVLKKIRPDLKAIIVSGFSESGKVKELQFLGAGSYLQKPYTMEQLGMAVRSELDN